MRHVLHTRLSPPSQHYNRRRRTHIMLTLPEHGWLICLTVTLLLSFEQTLLLSFYYVVLIFHHELSTLLHFLRFGKFSVKEHAMVWYGMDRSDWSYSEKSSQHHLYRPYTNTLFLAGHTSVTGKENNWLASFFDSVEKPRSCLHYSLLPAIQHALLSRLRVPSKFPRIPNITKKYQPFIS